MPNVIFEAFEMVSKATREARLIQHPKNKLKLFWLPISETVSRKPVKDKPNYYHYEIPEWLADKHDL